MHFKVPSIKLIILHFIVHENLFSTSEAFTGKIWRNNNGANALDINKPQEHNGKVVSVKRNEPGGIMWEDLAVKKQGSSYILAPSSGYIANGHVCGILGPSGSGKTTFLSTIAGRPEASLRVEGHVLHCCSEEKDTFHCAPVMPDTVAWLQQHDAFFERLTVKETLDLAVFLELPELTAPQRDQVANGCLESLGLSKLKSRQIGNAKNSRTSDGASLSGGELRRLSVALELVTKPNLFIADEPTSGIDAKMSENVMMAISSLAKERQIPCFCTLHSPRSSIWHMLDTLILMSPGGRICYIGSREDSVDYFASLGYDCPEETNPAEFFIDLVSVDTEDPIQASKDKNRIDYLARIFAKKNRKATKSLEAVRTGAPLRVMEKSNAFQGKSPIIVLRVIRRFAALFRRSWRQTIRSKSLNVFRLSMSVGTALLLSQIFPSVAKGSPTTKSVADRICLLSFGVINMFMIAIMKTIGIFAKEKPVVQRERSRNDYTSFEYILSKSLAEIPMDTMFAVVFATTLKFVTGLAIGWDKLAAGFSLMTVGGASLGFLLGSITKSEEAAVATAMPVCIILMIVGVINPSGVDPTTASPFFIQIVKNFSPIAAAIEALAVCEFSGMEFASSSGLFGFKRLRDLPRMGGLAMVKNGDEVLEALGLKGAQYDLVMAHMIALSVVNFGLCWLGLHISDIRWKNLLFKLRSFFPEQKRAYMVKKKRKTRSKQTCLEPVEGQSANAMSDYFPLRIMSKSRWIPSKQVPP